MILKGIIDEDFVNYKKPGMTLFFPNCSFKCDKDCGMRVCQNSALATSKNIEANRFDVVSRYLFNPITESIIFSGLEPFDSWEDLKLLVKTFREKTNDMIVIYSGYTEEELEYECHEDYIENKIIWLQKYPNITIKFGRYIPNQESHYDEVLGVTLASPNQYAKVVS